MALRRQKEYRSLLRRCRCNYLPLALILPVMLQV